MLKGFCTIIMYLQCHVNSARQLSYDKSVVHMVLVGLSVHTHQSCTRNDIDVLVSGTTSVITRPMPGYIDLTCIGTSHADMFTMQSPFGSCVTTQQWSTPSVSGCLKELYIVVSHGVTLLSEIF